MEEARRGLALYLTVLSLISIFLEWKILHTGESIDRTPLLVLALMYTPAVASIVARMACREGFSDVSFRFGGREGGRALLIAWMYPIIMGFLAYGTAWATGLATFQPPLPAQSRLHTQSAATNLLASLALMATVGTVVSCLSAF